MIFLKRIFYFYVRLSLHVALAITCLSGVTFLKWHKNLDAIVLCFIFLISILAYNFVKYATLPIAVLKRQKDLLFLNLSCIVLTIVVAFFLPLKMLWWSVLFLVLTLLYSFPVRSNIKNFRNRYGIKAYLIATCWAGIGVGMPLLSFDAQFTLYAGLVAGQVFLFVLVWLIPFDLRDMDTDSKDLGTIPLILGIRKTKIVGSFLLLSIVLLTFLKSGWKWDTVYLICLLSAVFLWMAQKKQPKYFSSFWVESIPIVWLFVEFFGKLK